MITQNYAKKQLVERLIKESKISLDEAIVLLEEQEYIIPSSPITYPSFPQQPWWNPNPVLYGFDSGNPVTPAPIFTCTSNTN